MRLVLKSPAKINWFLLITGKRSDGYHELFSLMQKISLFDTLSFETIDKEEIRITTNIDLPLEDNLIYRAAILLRKYTQCNKGAHITLQKDIPLQAGLGGGSSNAATTLLGLNMLWNLGLKEGELSSLASELGSDVAFFISNGAALVEGRGEKVTPYHFNGVPPVYILLVMPDFGVSTAQAYSEVKSYSKRDDHLLQVFNDIIKLKRYDLFSGLLLNDLEEPVFRLYPELRSIKEELLSSGALGALLSGSGSTVFAVFRERQEAESIMTQFKDRYWCRIVEPV